jgi:hypothetical protein
MGSSVASHIQSQVSTDITSVDSRPAPSLSHLSTRQPPPLPLSETDFTEAVPSLDMKVEPESKSPQVIKLTDVAETLTKEVIEIKSEVVRATAPPPDLTFTDQGAAEYSPDDHNSESDRPFQAENKDSLMEDASASSGELPVFPLCLDLCEGERREVRQMAIRRIIDGKSDSYLRPLARMVALVCYLISLLFIKYVSVLILKRSRFFVEFLELISVIGLNYSLNNVSISMVICVEVIIFSQF